MKKQAVQKPCIDRADPEFSGLHNKRANLTILRSIYDILLNLKKYEDSCEFYEWRESDEVEHIKRFHYLKYLKQ